MHSFQKLSSQNQLVTAILQAILCNHKEIYKKHRAIHGFLSKKFQSEPGYGQPPSYPVQSQRHLLETQGYTWIPFKNCPVRNELRPTSKLSCAITKTFIRNTGLYMDSFQKLSSQNQVTANL